MNEEEREIVKKFERLYLKDFNNEKITNEDRLSYIECALMSNLIEKLQKENEELKLKEKRRIIGKYGEFEIHDVINRTLSNDYISVKKIKDKIEELNSRIEIYTKYVEQGVETDVEWVDNVADRETVKVLQELIEEREEN